MGTVPGTKSGTKRRGEKKPSKRRAAKSPASRGSSAKARPKKGAKKAAPSVREVATDPVESGMPSALVADIEGVPDEGRWLIEELWAAGGVGIVGGTPKTGKTWFTLEFAVAVASGTPAFGRFRVPEAGPVVAFPAEDSVHAVRDRVASLAQHKGLSLSDLPLRLITARKMRLDEESDRRGLRGLLERERPKLVILDPLVRLHGGDENYLGHVAELLGFLRGLQREYGSAILLTHHIAKRRGGKGAQAGQGLRGSGELHAWGDSNLYLTRTAKGLVRMEIEHRAARSADPLHIALVAGAGGTHLELVEGVGDDEEEDEGGKRRTPRGMKGGEERRARESEKPLHDRVLEALAEAGGEVSQTYLRDVLRVRNQKLTEVLHGLASDGRIERPGGKHRWRSAQLELNGVGER